MLEFTLLVLPKEINASGTVKSVKSASICLWTVSISVTKYSPSWGMQLWWKAITLGLILLDMHLNLKATKSESSLDNLHCLSAFYALVLACRISPVYHGICGRITVVFTRFKLLVEELFSLDYLYNVERQGNPRLLHTILFFCSCWTNLEFKGRQPKESV